MTGTQRDSNTPTQCPSSVQPDTLDQPNDKIRSSDSPSQQQHQHQQHDTPRAKRFSQKLVNAAKKQPLARTPSTTASLSPPLESCMADDNDDYDNDELMADTDSSCFASPSQDDQLMNNHFQNLLLSSPLRPELTMMRPLELDNNHPSSAIPDDYSELNGILTRRRLQDKRPVKHQPISDSPSLSAKPKRRKLKQQRTTSWRTGADVTLDTNKIHIPVESSQQRRPSSPTPTSPPPHQPHGNTRRSSRLANRKVSYGETAGIASKKPLVMLGIPGGVKTESEPTSLLLDDGDYSGRNGNSSSSSSNEQQQQQQSKPVRKIRRRVDTVENRLTQLIFARDTLDLSQHSVLPTSGDRTLVPSSTQQSIPPVVVIVDDSGNESDGHADDSQPQINSTTEPGDKNEQPQHIEEEDGMETTNNDQTGPGHDNDRLVNTVKSEPIDECMDLPSIPFSTDQAAIDNTIDEDMDMTEADETDPLTKEPSPPPATDTAHTQDERDDDDMLMTDERQIAPPPKEDCTSQDRIPPPPSPKDDQQQQQNIISDHEPAIVFTANTTIRAPSSCSPTPPELLNDPLLATSSLENDPHHDTITSSSPHDDNAHLIQPPPPSALASTPALASTFLEEATAATSIPKATEHPSLSPQPSQQAKDMYTFLVSEDETGGGGGTTESPPPPPVEPDNTTIGSSESTTLFGRLIGSASHFFLGN